MTRIDFLLLSGSWKFGLHTPSVWKLGHDRWTSSATASNTYAITPAYDVLSLFELVSPFLHYFILLIWWSRFIFDFVQFSFLQLEDCYWDLPRSYSRLSVVSPPNLPLIQSQCGWAYLKSCQIEDHYLSFMPLLDFKIYRKQINFRPIHDIFHFYFK